MEEITRDLENVEPAGATLDLVAGADLETLSEDQKVTAYIVLRKIHGLVDHLQLSILSSFEDTTELAMAIKEPEQSVVRHKELSGVLDRLPRLSDLLGRGEIDLRRLEAVDERVVNLPTPQMIAQVEDAVLETAPGLTRTQLARRTTRLVAEVDPTGYEQRCQKAKAERRVEITPLPDGMAALKAILPAVQAREIYDVLTQDADTLPKDERTTDQKRADCFQDRFLGYGVDRKVTVHVTISIETLLGLTEDPGLLNGYGPIAADLARELAMHDPWRGLLLDQYRHATALGTDKYRPDAATREYVTARDGGTCTAPGCTKSIRELDHVIPWPKGKTKATQLKGLCAFHHHRKHDNYTVTLNSNGTAQWITPLGRTYTTTPHEY
jgi:Domain of unknown function (DUF222)